MNCKIIGCVQPKSSSAWHTGLSGGAPDSVRCARLVSGENAALGIRRWRTAIIHRTVRWCTGLSGESSAANSSLSGNRKGDMAIIHRTVRWCTGLSGEPTVGRAIFARRVAAPTVGGAPDYPVCTRQCPLRQWARSYNGRLCQIWKAIAHRTVYRTYPVAHRTVPCATRQNARMTFQVCLQRLLAALGL
jgi:hypothetical protein